MQCNIEVVYGTELLWSRLFFRSYIFKILVINIHQVFLTEMCSHGSLREDGDRII